MSTRSILAKEAYSKRNPFLSMELVGKMPDPPPASSNGGEEPDEDPPMGRK